MLAYRPPMNVAAIVEEAGGSSIVGSGRGQVNQLLVPVRAGRRGGEHGIGPIGRPGADAIRLSKRSWLASISLREMDTTVGGHW